MKASNLFRRMTRDPGKDNIEVIKNVKVIGRKDDASYEVKQSVVERAREAQAAKSATKGPRKGRIDSQGK